MLHAKPLSDVVLGIGFLELREPSYRSVLSSFLFRSVTTFKWFFLVSFSCGLFNSPK